MTKMFRPVGWRNPYREKVGDGADFAWSNALQDIRQIAFEEGADAMLEALRQEPDPIDTELDWRRATTEVGNLNVPQPEAYCKIPGCSEKVVAAHGYCHEHY